MYRLRFFFLFGLLTLLLLAAQCNNPLRPAGSAQVPPTATPTAPALNQPPDLLDEIRERGYIKVGVRVWPDANFNPPLFRSPLAGLEGYEVDLAWEIADGLGVELEMAESDPRLISQGNWDGEWDIALAWLPMTDNAQQHLNFSVPYAYDAASLVTHGNNESIIGFASLSDKRVGVPAVSIYQEILEGAAPSVQGQYLSGPIPPNIDIRDYNRDGNALRELAEGDGQILDAVIHSRLVAQTAIADDMPLKAVGEPLFWAPIGLAFDRSGQPSERLRVAIDEIITRMHADGRLSGFSLERYGEDISQLP